jgi:hypothetical protein
VFGDEGVHLGIGEVDVGIVGEASQVLETFIQPACFVGPPLHLPDLILRRIDARLAKHAANLDLRIQLATSPRVWRGIDPMPVVIVERQGQGRLGPDEGGPM